MIRVVALKQWCRFNNVPLEVINLLTYKEEYKELFKAVPHTVCTSDYRQLVQAQKLSGIPSRHINEKVATPYTPVQFSRITKRKDTPEAYILQERYAQHTYEWYGNTAKYFWFDVLEPLQMNDYYNYEYPIEAKLCILLQIIRNPIWTHLYRNNAELLETIKVLQSLEKPSAFDIFNTLPDDYPKNACRAVRALNLKPNSTYLETHSTNRQARLDVLEKHEYDITQLWDLLMFCNCQGIINNNLMQETWRSRL